MGKDGYRQLVERFGIDAVATALLTKWLSDPDAAQRWERLAAVIAVARPPELTPAERDVLRLRAAGLSTSQAARARGRSYETAKTQARNATAKLGARNLSHAVAIAIRSGQIEPPSSR